MVIVNNPLNSKKSFINIIEGDKNIVVFRFTSISCGPCQTVKPMIEEFKEKIKDNSDIHWYDIDTDESIEIFGMLKTKRIVNGIPAIICYMDENNSIYPDEFVLGADKKQLDILFDKLIKYSN